jgi:hypothetical protein
MMETMHSTVGATAEIMIVGLHRDKTRRTTDSNYRVYFELSDSPGQPWRSVFEQEWKTLNPHQPTLWEEVSIDGRFLVMHCPLQEVADTYFPLLKEAVAATNISYPKLVQKLAAEHERQVEVWKKERKSVDEVADALRFD